MPGEYVRSESMPLHKRRVKKAVACYIKVSVRSWKCTSLRLGNSIKHFAAAVMAFRLEKTPTVKFNNGLEIPIFGLGTWKVSQSFSAKMCWF